ncbi:hypothetical protein [Candidatus Nardonella dryophthoridicola]|uniref:hypothetical protein n=1 Tax=Candidatus Nardonella dryophthoridicola TaxID=1971485 RepID=UPI001AD87FE5|nr:hypothetical protein [Candidatus Nardonella dryophthoridicola]QTJ62935.1 hypothetical protein JRY34_00290 [Candidatus Nardonella dryophthoridicola]
MYNNFQLVILLSKISKNIHINNENIFNNNKSVEKVTIKALKIKNKYINFNNYNEIIIK